MQRENNLILYYIPNILQFVLLIKPLAWRDSIRWGDVPIGASRSKQGIIHGLAENYTQEPAYQSQSVRVAGEPGNTY